MAEQSLISNDNLARIGFDHELDLAIILNAGTVTVSKKTMSTTVEALIGAVFKHSGLGAVKVAVQALGITHPYLEAVTLMFPLPALHIHTSLGVS